MSIFEKKQLVTAFLLKCNDYADRQLATYRREAVAATGLDAVSAADQIHNWTVYKAFNEYAIEELGGTGLDDWFE